MFLIGGMAAGENRFHNVHLQSRTNMSPDLRARLASLAGGEWRGTPHIFDRLSTTFCKKSGENKKWNLAKPDFIRLGDSESLLLRKGGK